MLRLADRNAYAAAGTRSSSPRGALAFKYAAEEKTTVLADVVWDVGKIGKVAPVAVLEPVFVGGTTVTRATLANQEVIRARDVRIGDTVLVRRAGDVIPFVAGVLDAAGRTGAEREIVAPTECPSCAQPLTEQGNSRELYCTNVACPAQTVRRLIHWASRSAADIEAVGPVWIERLCEAGLLERPSDFYALGRDDLLAFDGIAEVSADRMLESIGASRGVGLRRALIGMAIPMASEAAATRLCRAGYRSLEEVADAGEDALQQVEDIGPKVAASLYSHLARDSTRAEIARLRELGVDLDVREEDLPPEVVSGAPLAGKTVVVTGAIADPRSGEKVARPVFQRLCERAGATTASSVSANTDILICGADVGAAKTAKAEKLGVDVVDQARDLAAADRRRGRLRLARQRPNVRRNSRPCPRTPPTISRTSARPARSSGSPTSTGRIESCSSARMLSASPTASTARSRKPFTPWEGSPADGCSKLLPGSPWRAAKPACVRCARP